MRGTLLIGLVAFVGCGASQAAPVAAPAVTSAVAPQPEPPAAVAPDVVGAVITPAAPPSGVQVQITGVPGLNGNYTLPRRGGSAPGAFPAWQRYALGSDPMILFMVDQGSPADTSFMQFMVPTGGLSSPLGYVVERPAREGTFGFGGGTVTISAIP